MASSLQLYVSTNNYSPIWNIAWGEVAMATEKGWPSHDFHYEQTGINGTSLLAATPCVLGCSFDHSKNSSQSITKSCREAVLLTCSMAFHMFPESTYSSIVSYWVAIKHLLFISWGLLYSTSHKSKEKREMPLAILSLRMYSDGRDSGCADTAITVANVTTPSPNFVNGP